MCAISSERQTDRERKREREIEIERGRGILNNPLEARIIKEAVVGNVTTQTEIRIETQIN